MELHEINTLGSIHGKEMERQSLPIDGTRTGYFGGLKERKAKDMMAHKPEEVLKKAILGMLKRNKNLRHQSFEPRLMINVGPDHPHVAQLPSDTTMPLLAHPRARSGDFHFGLKTYNSLMG